MRTRGAAAGAALLLLLGCSRPGPSPAGSTEAGGGAAPARETAAPDDSTTFVNHVWRVAQSTGASPGELVVFLSEGTLVFASPNAKPAFGSWKHDGTLLTMVEDGIPYKVDILSLSHTEFRTRSHNPGGTVETRYVRAAAPPGPMR